MDALGKFSSAVFKTIPEESILPTSNSFNITIWSFEDVRETSFTGKRDWGSIVIEL